MGSETELVILGLTRPEALDLKNNLADCGDVRLDEKLAEESAYGVIDPVSIVVVALGVTALRGLTAWLLKDRHGEVIEHEVELRGPDGTVERRTIRIQRSASTTGGNVDEILKTLTVPKVS